MPLRGPGIGLENEGRVGRDGGLARALHIVGVLGLDLCGLTETFANTVSGLLPPCTCGFSAKNFLSNGNTNCCQVKTWQGKVNNALARDEDLSSAACA